MDKDQYLLKNEPGVKTTGALPSDEFDEGIQSQSNRRVGVTRLALRVHNFGRSLEKTFYKKKNLDSLDTWWARRVKGLKYSLGEPPKLLDTTMINRDERRLRNICFANGYFHPLISYEIDTLDGLFGNQQQAKVTFNIKEGTPYRIHETQFIVDDSTVNYGLLKSQYFRTPSLIQKGKIYSHSLFGKERSRATTQTRIGSYYSFEPGLINFVVDTNLVQNDSINALPPEQQRNKWVNIDIRISGRPIPYKIQEIEFQLLAPAGLNPKNTESFNPSQMTLGEMEALGIKPRILDSSIDLNFVVSRSLLKKINYNFLTDRVRIRVGQFYSLKEDNRTRQMLRELGMFQYLLIRYQTLPGSKDKLKMIIEGRLVPQYQVKMGLEVFSNDITETTNLVPNAGLQLSLRNKNALKKSEILDLSLIGNIGYNTGANNNPRDDFISFQTGAEASIQFYEFLFIKPFLIFLPPNITENLSRYSPTTILSSSINFKQFNGINQIVPSARITYQWQHFPSFPNKAVSRLSPLLISFFDPQNNPSTQISQALDPTQIGFWDFQERLTSRLTYSYTHQNYRETRSRPTSWYQLGFEYGGLIPNLIERYNLSQGTDRGPDTINSIIEWFPDKSQPVNEREIGIIHYGYFGKLFAEGKVFFPIRKGFDFVVRGKAGAAAPFFNSRVIPKEGRFFSGGVNGLRGWQANTLGPGRTTLVDFGFEEGSVDNFGPLLSPGGDFMFEANAELRLRPISWVELALFTDVGNVWLNRRSAEAFLGEGGADKAVLSRDNLYMGWDTGLGLRLDFAYLILRFDLGLQLYAPSRVDPDLPGSGWNVRLLQENIFPDNFINPIPSIGLNYPF